VGKDNDVSKWVQVSGGIGMTTATGRTRVDVRDFYLPAGKYGMCVLYASGGQRYTLGIGSNQSYGNADVFMSLGATKASRFGGSLDTNRVWNGAICYDAPDKATSGAYGFGCAGTGGVFPTFRLSSEPKLGASTSFDVNNMVSSGGPAWLYLGIIHTPGLDMGPFGMPGCSMFTFPTITVVGIPNSGGSTSIPVSIPNDPSLMFGIMGMQVFNVDAGASSPLGIAATAGHAIRIGN